METVKQHIIHLREQRTSCSQVTLSGICRGLANDIELPAEETLMALSAGLRGGIGRTYNEGTCGALTGAVIALGLLFKDDEAKALELSRELFNDFKDEFGTVICGKITNEHGLGRCTDCCIKAGCCVERMYKRENQYIQDI